MNTYFTNTLDNNLKEKVYHLIDICKESDNLNGCIFLEEELNTISNLPCYIYCVENTLLIGFLSIFVPDINSCEIYSYVHPEYRHKHIFTNMYNNALNILNGYGISYIQIVCEPGSPGEHLIQAKGYSDYICECMMKYQYKHTSVDCSDYKLIVSKDNELVKLAYNNIILGHCRIDYKNNCTTIYDVEILAKYQGHGYSKVLINMTLDHISQLQAVEISTESNTQNLKEAVNKKSSIVLHVTASNTKALRAYISCGFEIIEELHFYNINPSNINQSI